MVKRASCFSKNVNKHSIVIDNGNLSQHFNIEREVTQGLPLSSIIFIVCIEILSEGYKAPSKQQQRPD